TLGCVRGILGYGGRGPPWWWGCYHEPSHCRRGMWLNRCGGFRLNAEPELSQLLSARRSISIRVRTPPSGRQNPLGADLSHTLRAHGAGRSRAIGDLCAQWLPAADSLAAHGAGVGI